jgi:hypothetical protein
MGGEYSDGSSERISLRIEETATFDLILSQEFASA